MIPVGIAQCAYGIAYTVYWEHCYWNFLKCFNPIGSYRRRETGEVGQEMWDRRRETRDRRRETWDRRRETWDMTHDTRNRRHATKDIDIKEVTWYKRQEPFFPQLTTKHSDTQHFSNRNVCDRSQRKSALNWSQICFWLIKETFSLWSITNMSVIDDGKFWHCQSGEMTV